MADRRIQSIQPTPEQAAEREVRTALGEAWRAELDRAVQGQDILDLYRRVRDGQPVVTITITPNPTGD